MNFATKNYIAFNLTNFDTTHNSGGIPAKIGQHFAKFSKRRQNNDENIEKIGKN